MLFKKKISFVCYQFLFITSLLDTKCYKIGQREGKIFKKTTALRDITYSVFQ